LVSNAGAAFVREIVVKNDSNANVKDGDWAAVVAETNFQESGHSEGHDYARGSPHLKHPSLSAMIMSSLDEVISSLGTDNPLEILEVGAGHGTFTAALVSLGANVTVTEMSKDSATYLSSEFENSTSVEVVYDPDGSWAFRTDQTFDAVICVSVLHHIPDYLAATERYCELIRPGGSFVSWQDPLLYSGVEVRQRRAAVLSYYLWRVTQGGWLRALNTASRRVRGVLDETKLADMVEYHVVRDGVDEQAISSLLTGQFDSVSVRKYWSTQASWLQSLGERRGYKTTFGIVAEHRKN
jgi:SAM-dependent methyltransferase